MGNRGVATSSESTNLKRYAKININEEINKKKSRKRRKRKNSSKTKSTWQGYIN